jgi:DNA-directed RNA polymerase sigma subunit (sigma70/sigma32)
MGKIPRLDVDDKYRKFLKVTQLEAYRDRYDDIYIWVTEKSDLSYKLMKIVRFYYFDEISTLRDVGRRFNLTASRIKQLLDKAIYIINRPVRKERLINYLEECKRLESSSSGNNMGLEEKHV